MSRMFLATLLLVASASAKSLVGRNATRPSKPIILANSGGFEIGGQVITNPNNTAQHLSCDHGYMEYFIPWTPRQTSLVMWHSSSTQVFQNRWDGGEGYKDMWLRRDYPVYLWDGPRVGRANWACVDVPYTPSYVDEINFIAWNFGPSYMNWWNDTQFPRDDHYAWTQATSARYAEFDTVENVELHAQAAAAAADSGKLGDQIIYLTNSAGGLRALMTAVTANETNIAGMVTYESMGYVFPEGTVVPYNPDNFGPGFGPFFVPEDDFRKLASLKIQFLWGDHRNESFGYLAQSRQCAELINQYGGNATVFKLGDDAGLKGSSHIAFADMDNEKVAEQLDDFLVAHGLDNYGDFTGITS